MSLNEALNKVHCTVYTIFSIEIIVEEFELSLTSDMRLCWLCCTAICDWSRNCGSLFQPTTCKTKTSHDFFTCISGTTTSLLVFMLRLSVTLSISSSVVITCTFFLFFLQHLIWKCFATNSMSYSVEQLALVMTKCIKHIFSISNDCSPWISWMLCGGRIWFEQPESGWCIEISISFRYGTIMQNLKILNLNGIKMWWEQECSTWCT